MTATTASTTAAAATTAPGTATRTAADVLRWGRITIESALRAAVDTLPPATRVVAAYQLGWCDEHGRPADADGGKALRPTLALLSAAAAGGVAERAVPAAVAVELVHTFSLVQDDVMDGDRIRRHRATAWTVFGRDAAILAGDALLTLAFDVLATAGPIGPSPTGPVPAALPSTLPVDTRPSAPRILAAAVQRLLAGQRADLDFEGRADVDLAECRQMAEDKTAALLGAACELGAWFGRGGTTQVANLHGYGERLGLAFQLADDLLGIWGDPASTGKPVHSDLRSRKKTFPVVAALVSGTAAGAELLHRYREPAGPDAPVDEDELHRVAALIEEAGGRAWCETAAEDLLGQALGRLDAARPHGPAATELRALAALATRRDR